MMDDVNEVGGGRILDLTKDGWDLDISCHRDAALYCIGRIRPKLVHMKCVKLNQLSGAWNACKLQEGQGLGFVCEVSDELSDGTIGNNLSECRTLL